MLGLPDKRQDIAEPCKVGQAAVERIPLAHDLVVVWRIGPHVEITRQDCGNRHCRHILGTDCHPVLTIFLVRHARPDDGTTLKRGIGDDLQDFVDLQASLALGQVVEMRVVEAQPLPAGGDHGLLQARTVVEAAINRILRQREGPCRQDGPARQQHKAILAASLAGGFTVIMQIDGRREDCMVVRQQG